jgi:hypothetical protein
MTIRAANVFGWRVGLFDWLLNRFRISPAAADQ